VADLKTNQKIWWTPKNGLYWTKSAVSSFPAKGLVTLRDPVLRKPPVTVEIDDINWREAL
jgi:hypothetical protein